MKNTAKDLIRKMLVLSSHERPSCDEILRHPWLSNAKPENEFSRTDCALEIIPQGSAFGDKIGENVGKNLKRRRDDEMQIDDFNIQAKKDKCIFFPFNSFFDFFLSFLISFALIIFLNALF